MNEDFDLERAIKPFVKGSSLGLVISSFILFFVHYDLNRYFSFIVPSWVTFFLWLYLIGNSISLYRLLRNNIFECPNCKRRHKKR